MKKIVCLAIILLYLLAFTANAGEILIPEPNRTWTLADGRKANAKLIGVSENRETVILQSADGRESSVALERFSKVDQGYVKSRPYRFIKISPDNRFVVVQRVDGREANLSMSRFSEESLKNFSEEDRNLILQIKEESEQIARMERLMETLRKNLNKLWPHDTRSPVYRNFMEGILGGNNSNFNELSPDLQIIFLGYMQGDFERRMKLNRENWNKDHISIREARIGILRTLQSAATDKIREIKRER